MTSAQARIPYQVVQWAAAECERQRSGERSVAWMIEGWLYARRHRFGPVLVRDVLALGARVEPRKALTGFRTVAVGVRNGGIVDWKGPWEDVPRAIERLVEHQPLDRGPGAVVDDWYRSYEEIHPFADGNGRTGSILWNWLRGSLLDPGVPPDFWASDQASIRQRRERAMLDRADLWLPPGEGQV